MGTTPARMGVPGDFPGIFIQGYGFDFDGVGTFVVQQGDGVFAGSAKVLNRRPSSKTKAARHRLHQTRFFYRS